MRLRVDKLSKRFGGVQAVSNVTFELPEGRIIGLVGPNGAGKTTLFDLITGFIQPDSGFISINGRELSRIRPYELTAFGLARTFQDLRLIYDESVISNLLLWYQGISDDELHRAVFGIGKAKAKFDVFRAKCLDMLAMLDLEDRASDRAGNLSFGQQKLLSIACCLAAEAKILLLDEPTAGLQNDFKDKMQLLLHSLRKNSNSLFIIEHDLEFTREIADEIWVMDEGKIIEQGIPNEVLRSSKVLEAYLE